MKKPVLVGVEPVHFVEFLTMYATFRDLIDGGGVLLEECLRVGGDGDSTLPTVIGLVSKQQHPRATHRILA